MSDHFPDQNNAKLSNTVENLDFFQQDIDESVNLDELNSSYDHMYATNHEENGLSEEPEDNCQPESGVKFLKEFLLIHLDLIQQQNDDILNKENTIFLLQQENARLRERLRCMESGLPYQSSSNINDKSELSPDSFAEDMTQDSGATDDEQSDFVVIPKRECPIDIISEAEYDDKSNLEDNQLPDESIEIEAPIDTELDESELNIKQELEEDSTTEEFNIANNSTINDFNISENSEVNFSNTSYTIHSNSVNSSDPMKNLKMSIRRKRLCSNSSAVSNNDSMSDDKRNFRRSRKKRKRIVKNDQIMTHNEQYVTQVGDPFLDALRRQELADEAVRAAASTSNLEVPRWRVKVYTSCYTMEGTENLEDEAFLRRHNRLENDERRRKRWDVQRIREQRVVEKLKQRQDKIESNNKGTEQTEIIESLWPSTDDIKYIEMCDVLPVSAFGCPVPKIQPSEFSIPWLNNPNIKKTTTRRTTTRRRGVKR